MNHLLTEQRYQIEAYLKLGVSKKDISIELGVDRATIYREINRNKCKSGCYKAKQAQEFCNDRRDRFTFCRSFSASCIQKVEEYLKMGWSPEQITGYCRKEGIPMVSHERIYQHIRDDKLNGGQLFTYLRHRLKHRKRPVGKHYSIANRTSIEQRPEAVNLKLRFGDWEMDTIIGANQKGAILTLTERHTNFIFIRKLTEGKNSKALAKVLVDLLMPYKNSIHTITTDNGCEFADHLNISRKLKTDIYFAHAYCSWEKGSIENANKLIRQYIPKEHNLNQYTQDQLTEIQHVINNRPREKHGFEKPKNLFYNLVNGNVAFRT